ncbi:hypothetical protein DFJ73DRAFT_180402 [Zopfochytrium polystomum]|nr:hypothetical protein DFJ73DRAFT_180402 [Zopfochytrium polystomum]
MNKWAVDDCCEWLGSIGLSAYEQEFRDNDITGDVLVHADHDMLRQLKVTSVGHRLLILRGIKAQRNGEPPDAESRSARARPDEAALEALWKDVSRLEKEVIGLRSDLDPVLHQFKDFVDHRKPNTVGLPQRGGSSSSFQTASSSSTLVNAVSPSTSVPMSVAQSVASPEKPGTPASSEKVVGTIRVSCAVDSKKVDVGAKSFKVSTQDTCAKLLPSLLKRYGIDEPPARFIWLMRKNNKERTLATDERPLSLQNSMQDEDGVPVFIIKRKLRDQPRTLNSSDTLKGSTKSPSTALSSQDLTEPYAVALQDFKAEREDEISLERGDRVVVLKKDADWCSVKKMDTGSVGWVPSSFLVDSMDLMSKDRDKQTPLRGTVAYDFVSESPPIITIRKGDVVDILKWNDLWFLVETRDQKGWIPKSYVLVGKDQALDTKESDVSSVFG